MSHEIVKKGYLYKLPVKGFMKKWTKKWFVLYATSQQGVVRVEYYDNEECATSGVGKRTILLRDCTDISNIEDNKIHPYIFQFRTQLGHHVLAAESQLDMKGWMDYIKEVVHDDKIKRRRSKAQSRVIASSSSDLPDTLNYSGLSYRNKVDSGTYRVTIKENETSTKMNLSGTYNLELYPSKFTLIASSGITIFTLYYKSLKNYGKQSSQFHFEVGKNSPIIEGELIFDTTCSKEIFGVIHNNIKRLNEQALYDNATEHAAAKPAESQVKVKPSPPKPLLLRSRPGSQHSTDVHNESVPGTYLYSENIDLHGTRPNQAAQVDVRLEVPTTPYSVVDKSKKTEMEKKKTPTPKQSNGSQVTNLTGTKGTTYTDPYVSDHLACRAPSIPSHHSSVRDSSISALLVKIEENNYEEDSNDESHSQWDESNLESLAEGVGNPLDAINFGGSEGVTETTEYLGFHPCNFKPINVSDTSSNSTNMANFNFGQMSVEQQFVPGAFSSMNIAVASQVPPASNIAEFDFGSLDANFIAKLNAMEVKDKQVPLDPGSGPTTLSTDELDYFWKNIDTSLQ